MSYSKVINNIIKILDSKKAENIKVYKDKRGLCDYIIVATCVNSKNGNALINYVEEFLVNENIKYKKEGINNNSKWFIIDGYDFILNIIDNNSRNFYLLDDLYC